MAQPQVAVVTGVNDQSLAVQSMLDDWLLAADLLGGTTAMRRAGTRRLPRWPKEEPDDYTTRLGAAVLFPAYQRTIQTLSGKPFSKPITLGEDIDERTRGWLQNVDLEGRNLDSFAADVFEGALGYGLGGIFVEYPRRGKEVRTQAQEAAAGLRPYWVHVRAAQILGWRAQLVGGMWQLTQLRFMELIEVPDGQWGTKTVEQVRVLSIGAWETWRAGENGNFVLFESGTTTLRRIPFVPIQTGRLAFMVSKPPLIEVAHLNVAHWQSASDQQTILHVARVPILVATGVEDAEWELTVGASTASKLPKEADLKFVEHSGAAIGAGVTELDKIEERMRQAGAELLVITPRVTATQVQTENAVGMCVLQRFVADFEDALDQALQITAEYVGGASAKGGHVTLFNDFGVATLQEASAQLLLQANQAGKISDETFHSEMQRRGILSADVSWEDEQARIQLQGPPLGEMGVEGEPGAQPPTGAVQQLAPQIGSVSGNGAPIDEPATAGVDIEALINSMGDKFMQAIEALPAPIVNIAAPEPQPPAQITVEAPVINVTVPEQPPAQINISPPAITVEAPQITMPDINISIPEQQPPVVNVSPAAVNVTTPPVTVNVQRPGSIEFTSDDDGDITGARIN